MDLTATIEEVVRDFVIKTFVWDQATVVDLSSDTDLVELGLLDSMNVLQLVGFIEEEYDFMLEPEDLFLLTTLDGICTVIRERIEG